MNLPLRYLRMGDGGVLFNEITWRTHILTPAAAIMLDALLEHSGGEPLPMQQATSFLKSDLGVDPELDETREFLAMLKHFGIVA